VSDGANEMKCIFDIGKNIYILAKVTQVSDVAHGPLVKNKCYIYIGYVICPTTSSQSS
jgi:hypothetical protein